MINIPIEEAATKENFDEKEFESRLIDEGYTPEAAKEKAAKKKESLNKDEDIPFEYVMKLETVNNDTDELIIAGFASSGELDHDNEAINQDSLKVAFNDYLKNPVLRFMHGRDSRNPDAIGRVIPEYVTADGQTLKTEFRDGKPFIVAKLSSAPDVESIRTKVREGVLTGFSVGGRANRVSEFSHRLGKNINRIHVKRLSEISVVDLPANKSTFFEVIKQECIGDSCNINNNTNDNSNESPSIIDDDYQNKNKTEEINMAENNNIEMEMGELEEFVKSTVSKMIEEQDNIEKAEAGAAAVAQAQDLRARIAELEAEVTRLAAQLKAQPQEAMKGEKEPEPIEETEDEKKAREAKEAKESKDDRVGKLEAEIAELKAAPMYKAEQNIEKNEETIVPVSQLVDVIRAHYGGN